MRKALILFLLVSAGFIAACKEKAPELSPEELARRSSLQITENARIDSIKKYNLAKQESLRVAEEKAREEARIKELKNTIRIISVYPSKPNSVGGVDAHTVWENTSNKVIKYITFEWVPFNAVGDAVSCRISGDSMKRGTVTGPINPGQTYGYGTYWECAWYNNTIKKIVLTEINIEYMDETQEKLYPSDIDHVYKKQW